MFVFALIALVSIGAASTNEQSRVVTTVQGRVRGYKDPDSKFYAFYGIPYATTPKGPNKFKGPLPPPTWSDILEANNIKTVCPQTSFFLQMIKSDIHTMEEDCLIANVFVPDTETTNLPVFVYVHGGGFQIGFGNMILQRSLLESKKVIIVNFNYRLGAHGFLCLGTDDVPGNAGMKDQVAALRWVKRNIASFGGNPDDVTLAGGSAGSAAVELLLLSKSTRGLFNKVIPESGSGVGVWATQSDPLDVARSYALSQGYIESGDVYALEDFFKNLSLVDLQAAPSLHNRNSSFLFVPCVEHEETEDAFLTDAPVNIIKKGDYEKLPVLIGFADMEGKMRLDVFEDWARDMNENFSEFLPADLDFVNEFEREKVARKIKKFYFGERTINADTAVGYVDYFSDTMFVYPSYRSVSLQAAAGSDSLYLYMYAFPDRTVGQYPGLTGAKHCAQSIVLGDNVWDPVNEVEISENYRKMQSLVADVWLNFMITGRPTPKGSLAEKAFGGEWLPTSPAQPHYALFNTSSELRGALLPERMKLWNDIYSKYYRTPIPPPKLTKKQKSEL